MLQEHVDERRLAALAKRYAVEQVDLALGEIFVDVGRAGHDLEGGQVESGHELAGQDRAELRGGVQRVGEDAPKEAVVGMRGHRDEPRIQV